MEQPSLRVSLALSGTSVRLAADPPFHEDLRRLLPRFRTARQISPGIVEVEVDDFLGNLIALANWPSGQEVHWEADIMRLAKTSVSDAAQAERILASGSSESSSLDDQLEFGPTWVAGLTSFQERDVKKLLTMAHGANFSVPGAGKTRATLAVFAAARHRGEVSRMLVVGPKSAYEAWQLESAECFEGGLKVEVLERAIPTNADIVLVNYERLDGWVPRLSEWMSNHPTMLVLDEAHRMKLGAQGTYGAACLALGPRAVRRLILTGTPAPNGARDLENLMGFVWPGHGRRHVTRAVQGGDLRKASAVLRPMFARTTKRDLDLPPQTISIRRVELPALHREIYDALASRMSTRAIGGNLDLDALGKVLMYLMMAATSPALLSVGTTRYEPLAYRVPPLEVPEGSDLAELMADLPSYELSPKYLETIQIVEENARQGKKTLVWSTFVRSLTTLGRLLEKHSPAIVHGGTLDREDQIQRFRTDPNCRVLLSNPATLGEGISLHKHCHDAVFVDRDFAAGRYLQALDRIHRLGLPEDQLTRVTVLSAAGTIDEVVEQRLDLKLKFMGQVLDDPDVEVLGDLDEEPSVAGGLDHLDVRAMLSHLNADSS